MNSIFYSSKSALNAQQRKLDNMSNNIANSTTTGYKAIKTNFEDLFYSSVHGRGVPTSGNDPSFVVGNGSRVSSSIRNFKQGPLISSGMTTDMAIDGEGFFRVRTADGSYAYTRDGSFNIDVNGDLVDDNGNYLDIDFAQGFENYSFNGKFNVAEDGTITIVENNETIEIGKINLYDAVGDGAMISVGGSLYVPVEGATVYEAQPGDFSLYQGYTEGSNVDMSSEMTDMIVTQRAFQMSSKALQTGDDMWGVVNGLKR